MHQDWEPSKNISERLKATGIDSNQIPTLERKAIVGEFISYWLTREGSQHRQSEWDHKLVQQIIKHQRTPKPVAANDSSSSIPNTRAEARREITESVMDIGNIDW
ncbi:MAG: DnaT-like ssDNA-binding domain-containing protein [Motiliproteus sp.]